MSIELASNWKSGDTIGNSRAEVLVTRDTMRLWGKYWRRIISCYYFTSSPGRLRPCAQQWGIGSHQVFLGFSISVFLFTFKWLHILVSSRQRKTWNTDAKPKTSPCGSLVSLLTLTNDGNSASRGTWEDEYTAREKFNYATKSYINLSRTTGAKSIKTWWGNR